MILATPRREPRRGKRGWCVRRAKKIKDDGVRRFGLVASQDGGVFVSRVDKAGQRESIHDRDLYHCQPCFHLDGDRRDVREPSIVPSRVTMPRPAGKVPSLVGIRNSCQNQKGIPDKRPSREFSTTAPNSYWYGLHPTNHSDDDSR